MFGLFPLVRWFSVHCCSHNASTNVRPLSWLNCFLWVVGFILLLIRTIKATSPTTESVFSPWPSSPLWHKPGKANFSRSPTPTSVHSAPAWTSSMQKQSSFPSLQSHSDSSNSTLTSHTHRRYSYNNTFDFSEGMLVMCFPNNIIFIVNIYVVVNFLSQVIFVCLLWLGMVMLLMKLKQRKNKNYPRWKINYIYNV